MTTDDDGAAWRRFDGPSREHDDSEGDDRPMLTAFDDLTGGAQVEHLREHHQDEQAATYGPTGRTAAHGGSHQRYADHTHPAELDPADEPL